ncbi:MAG: hypothetical protein ACRENU_12350 [Gemmatimonadaceae bacterium]
MTREPVALFRRVLMLMRFTISALALPVVLSAQRPDITVVPMELARVLVTFGEIGVEREAEIVVGRVAGAGHAALIPRGARVLGGVIYSTRRFPRAVTYLTMTESPDSALVVLGKALEVAGYKAAPTFEDIRGERGGFVSSSSSGALSLGRGMGSIINYCGDSSSVTAAVTDGDNRGSLARITSGSVRNSMCDPQMRSRMQMGSRMDEIEMPTLRPPAGATGGPQGSSGGGDSRSTYARLQSSLSAAEMIDHFAPQLREQGWTLVNRATDGDLSVQTARRANKDGEAIHLSLAAVRYGQREQEVTLRVWMRSRDR